jgi:hypothetical protein
MVLMQTLFANRFNVKAYTMCKYVDIVIDVLIFGDKLFSRYIFISHSPCLLRIMDEFFMHVAYSMFGTLLMGPIFRFSKSEINWLLQYMQIIIVNENITISVVLQAICDMDKLFWNICCLVLGTTTNEGQFKMSFIYQQL